MAIYHLTASVISRSNGHSAVGAAGYQARENLTHEHQRIGSVTVNWNDPASKKLFSADKRALTKGEVSENLRQVFRDNGIELSDNATAQKIKRDWWSVSDNGKDYTIRAFRETEWKKDEHGEKWINPETNKGKRVVRGQGLDIYGDREYNYAAKSKVKEDLVDKWFETPGKNTEYHTPEWVKDVTRYKNQDRQTYWNRAESLAVEGRRDSATAIRMEGALPREMTPTQRKKFVQDWVRKEFTSKGAICDIAIHQTTAIDGKSNPHVHILITTRIATENGFEDRKNPAFAVLEDSLNANKAKRKENLASLRESWAQTLNEHLAKAGFAHRAIDHRTLEQQGIDRKAGIHLGKHAANAEKKGIQTKRGDKNAARKFQNQQKDEAEAYRQERERKEILAHEQEKAALAAPTLEKQGLFGKLTRIFKRHKPEQRQGEQELPKGKKPRKTDRSRFVIKRKRMKWAHKLKAMWGTEHQPEGQSVEHEPEKQAHETLKPSKWAKFRQAREKLRQISHEENLNQHRTKEHEHGITR